MNIADVKLGKFIRISLIWICGDSLSYWKRVTTSWDAFIDITSVNGSD